MSVDEDTGEDVPWYPDWRGGYSCNEGQTLTCEDAIALGEAILRGLDSVPNEKCVGPTVNPLEQFGGPEGKEFLREIAEFCRGGVFRIS